MKNICLYFQNLFYYFSQLNIILYGHLISRAFTFCFNCYFFNYDFGLIKLNPVVGGYFEILFSWNLKLGCHLFELVWISYYKDHKSKSKQYELQHLITNCIFDHKHGSLMSLYCRSPLWGETVHFAAIFAKTLDIYFMHRFVSVYVNGAILKSQKLLVKFTFIFKVSNNIWHELSHKCFLCSNSYSGSSSYCA